MGVPACKVEIYNLDDALRHTIYSASPVHIHDILTTDVSTFSFAMPYPISGATPYKDIVAGWTAKIYMGYGTLTSSDLLLTGKIQKISSPLAATNGYVKIFSGKGLGEILERVQKTNTRYLEEEADDIVAALASDLGLGTDLDTETTEETITVRCEPYLSVLQKASDYWYDAGTQVKMDFYVDNSGNLVWKARPIRTEGVELIQYGRFRNYERTDDILGVRNNITVYGAANNWYPSDRELGTEGDSASWVLVDGDDAPTDSGANGPRLGTQTIAFYDDVNDINSAYISHDRLTVRDTTKLDFFYYSVNFPLDAGTEVRIMAPDTTNYFAADISTAVSDTWHHKTLTLGDANVYDDPLNPDGEWVANGDANWWDMEGVWFYVNKTAAQGITQFDALGYYPVRNVYTTSDATSIASYGQWDAEYTDDNLLTNSDCEKRAKTLLYQLKDLVTRLDVVLHKGTRNVRKGDRVPVTIAAEGYDAENFDIVSVDYDWDGKGFGTSFSALNTASVRKLPPKTVTDSVINQIKNVKQVTAEVYSRIIR